MFVFREKRDGVCFSFFHNDMLSKVYVRKKKKGNGVEENGVSCTDELAVVVTE